MADPAATVVRAVRSSHDRFVDLVAELSEDEVRLQSYAHDWSIADVASHLGSQAEIFALVLQAGLDGSAAPGGDSFTPIWDRWNALPPTEQVQRSIEANEELVSRVEGIDPEQAAAWSLPVFGQVQDFAGLLTMRLGEHAVHTWDIAVALDSTATVPADAVELLVDTLPLIAGRGGHPVAGTEPMSLTTTAPERFFSLELDPAVTLTPASTAGDDPATLPAEALLRLVYGRLGPDHTPADVTDVRLSALRTAFPGF